MALLYVFLIGVIDKPSLNLNAKLLPIFDIFPIYFDREKEFTVYQIQSRRLLISITALIVCLFAIAMFGLSSQASPVETAFS